MITTSSLVPSAVLQLSIASKLYVQSKYLNKFHFYLAKFDYAVCSQRDYEIRHLTPLTVEDLLKMTEASEVLYSTLQKI